MATRTKKTVHSGITREEADKAFADYAQAEAKYQSLNAKMEAEMMKVREKYNSQLVELDSLMDEKYEIVRQFAIEHRNDLFQDKKKVEWTHGAFGFRGGVPKLKAASGFTWNEVVERCREFLPDYVRTTHEVSKSKLLADRNNEKVSAQFRNVGIEVVNEERFYIETKK